MMQVFMNKSQEIKEAVRTSDLKHIAIIMDGNRRWAKQHLFETAKGHQKGADSLKTVLKSCAEFGIKYLTVYAFSTENRNRPKEEVNFLMTLMAQTIEKEMPEFMENGVKLRFIGECGELDPDLKDLLSYAQEQTKNNDRIYLQIAFNYGARAEITEAVKRICGQVKTDNLKIEDINESTISKYLYTKDIPDPDLLIRTGGEMRISNYLLWQCAYTEIYVTNTLWPDFNEQNLVDAIFDFQKRVRRFGK